MSENSPQHEEGKKKRFPVKTDQMDAHMIPCKHAAVLT